MIPRLKKDESKKEFVERCIAFFIGEGRRENRAKDLALREWIKQERERQRKKAKVKKPKAKYKKIQDPIPNTQDPKIEEGEDYASADTSEKREKE